MELSIEQAVLHVLDPQVDAPVLSEGPMAGEEGLRYLGGLAAKAFVSEEAKTCAFTEGSAAAPRLAGAEEHFLETAAALAGEWFGVLAENPGIPAGDAAFLLLNIDGADYLAGMKLNYKSGYAHYFEMGAAGAVNQVVRQDTLLPTKAEEAFFAPLAGGPLKVLEKKYDIDGHKQAYLARRVLGAKPGLSPKEKLDAIRDVAVEVNQQFYGNTGVEEPEVAAAVCAQFREYRAAASQPGPAPEPAPVAELCETLYGDMPHAREAFSKALAEREIALDEPLPMPAASVRRLEKQSLHSAGGVEIKVPVDVYRDESALEFIHNPDGTLNLLIKNVLL